MDDHRRRAHVERMTTRIDEIATGIHRISTHVASGPPGDGGIVMKTRPQMPGSDSIWRSSNGDLARRSPIGQWCSTTFLEITQRP